MDNSASADTAAWSTSLGAILAVGIGGALLAAAAIAAPTDPPGRVLMGLAAIGCFAIAFSAGRQRPRLAATPGPSLTLRRLTGDVVYPLRDIRRVRVVRYPRLGRRVPMLEIDIRRPADDDERLIIFGRWDLGTHPEDVFDELNRRGLVPAEGH